MNIGNCCPNAGPASAPSSTRQLCERHSTLRTASRSDASTVLSADWIEAVVD
jgi:hypothetical protein